MALFYEWTMPITEIPFWFVVEDERESEHKQTSKTSIGDRQLGEGGKTKYCTESYHVLHRKRKV